MDYTTLFQHQEFLQGGDFSCFILRQGGHIALPVENTHHLTFVLQGSIHLKFEHQNKNVSANEVVVISRKELHYIECQPNTIILKYTPPKKLIDFLNSCFAVLNRECSTPITMRPHLREWIEQLLGELSVGAAMDIERCCYYRRQLADALSEYSQEKLDKLYVPFYLCSSASCHACWIK